MISTQAPPRARRRRRRGARAEPVEPLREPAAPGGAPRVRRPLRRRQGGGEEGRGGPRTCGGGSRGGR